MLRTPLCDLLSIEHPVIQAGMGPFTSARLTAAVSEAGGLGSLGAGTRTAAQLRAELARLRELTDRPFAVNHTVSNLDEDAFAVTLAARPAVVSFALSDPGELVERAHRAGALVAHQVTTVAEARTAVERGVDVIIAQGGEAGGFGGRIAGLVLVPQVVDAVHPIPVVAAGGIADGRGLAAALCLGAQAVEHRHPVPGHPGGADPPGLEAGHPGRRRRRPRQGRAVRPRPARHRRRIPHRPAALASPFTRKLTDPHDIEHHLTELRTTVTAALDRGALGELMPF